MSIHPALRPVRLAGLDLPNRAVVAPMSRVSTTGDGVPTAAMADYYARFAAGGFGLVVTEGTYTDDAYSQAYPNQPGIVTPAQRAAWRTVAEATHAAGGRIVLQLMHAGALVQGNGYRTDTIGPSAVPPRGRKMPAYGGQGDFAVPREATGADIDAAVAGFAAAADAARTAGFDGVEIHGANGYLVDQFLTRYTNLRSDRYGGDVRHRVRLAAEVTGAVRQAVGPGWPVGIRLSQTKVNDVAYRWQGAAEATAIVAAVAHAGADYLHMASEGTDWAGTATLDNGQTVTALARSVTDLPVLANGGMQHPAVAGRIIDDGHADLVALGRGALANPDWPHRLADGRPIADFDPATLDPDVRLPTPAAAHRG